jgi:hypothetical protein
MNNAIGSWNSLPQSLPSQSRQTLDSDPSARSGNTTLEGRGRGIGQGLATAPGQNRVVGGAEPADRAAGKNFDVDGLVANLWGFMQGRLAEAQASGASESEMDKMWQAAEKGLRQGFGQAREALEAMNKMNDGLESKIDAAYQGLTDILEARDLTAKAPVTEAPSGDNLATDNRRISLYQYREQTFELNLKTSEGDRIRIQVRNTDEAGADFQRNQSGESLSWGRTGSSDFKLQIQGDLNDTERADLNALLGQVNDLANEFYDGDMALAWEKAQALSIDGTSLASMDLRMRDVEAKGVAAYQSAGGEQQLPRGLEALRDYARDMVAAQQQWIDRFDSRDAFPEALKNNPMNDGRLEAFTRSLLGG